MRALLAIAGKDLRDILRERSILVSILVQLFIAGFSTFLSVGLTGLYDPSSIENFPEADVGYVGPGGFDGQLNRANNLNVIYLDLSAARDAFAVGNLDAVVEERYAQADGVRTVSLLVPEDTIEGTLLLTQMKSALQSYEQELRTQRQGRLVQPLLEAPANPQTSSDSFAFVYASLLPLLVFTPIFLSGAIAGDAFVHEVQTRSLLLLRSAPISGWGLVLAKLLVPVLLAPAQVLLWIGLFALNGLPVANLGLLLGLAAVLALMLASLSIALGAWVRHEGQVQASYALIVLVLAVASLLLPSDPLNLIALLSTGSLTSPAISTLGILVAASLATASLALPFAARRIRRDQV
jgi:ABC-2 type transport system permease protein